MNADQTVDAQKRYTNQRRDFWDDLYRNRHLYKTRGDHYRRHLIEVYRRLVPEGADVLEIGCGPGDLLAALKPAYGLGLDFSSVVIEQAAENYPHLEFQAVDAHEMKLDRTFDVVILSDLVDDLWDIQAVFNNIRRVCRPDTRVILNFYSHLWELPLKLTARAGWSRPKMPQNWLTVEDVDNLLHLTGFERVRGFDEYIFPFDAPMLTTLFNRYLARLFPFSAFCLAHVLVTRPAPEGPRFEVPPRVTVVVPARNESGNIERIFERTPEMGGGTELIFVEGGSTDDTYEAVERAIEKYPARGARLYRQTGKGKGDAVRLGYAQATGDVLMILDADMTVAPEDLPKFFEALYSGKGEFINGVRLVYPMEKRAMRFFNLLGNKFFSKAFSWLLGQSVKDTLCGTKVMTRANYEKLAANRAYFGEFDPFGDFDLIFGATKLNLRIIDLPIRYRERVYGDTNISRWRHGAILLRMVAYASRKLKFV